MPSPITTPGGFVPMSAMSFSGPSGATLVDAAHPLPTSEPSFRGASALEPGVEQAPGRGVAIVASVAGTVQLRFSDDSLLSVPVQPGLSILPFAIKTVVAAGTSAVATFVNLI